MAGELFNAMAGLDIVHVPFKGSDGARVALLGGQVQLMFDATNTMAPHAREGRVKVLATTGSTRSPLFPSVPTMQQGGLAGYEATAWLGLMAPKGTPRHVVDKLNAAVNRIVEAPEVKQAWAVQGTTSMPMSPEAFGNFLRAEIDKWGKVVKASGATPD
jgi:tripartite-type tricarboxylate transporter receptor subunit TctC